MSCSMGTQVIVLAVMAASGGAMAPFAPAADVCVGMAALGAGRLVLCRWRSALPLWVRRMAIAVSLTTKSMGLVVGTGAAALGGLASASAAVSTSNALTRKP